MMLQVRTPSIGGYYGGKASMVAKILPYFPTPIKRLSAAFCGFASAEIASDAKLLTLSDANINTYAVLLAIRDDPDWLIESMTKVPWGREFFHDCQRGKYTQAIVGMALSAMSHHRGGSVSGFSQQQCDRAAKRDWSYLLKVSERLQRAAIYCQDFRDTLRTAPSDSMLYLDPPYLDGGQHYQHTMSIEDHREMLTLAKQHPGPVAISGYDSELYNQHIGHWRRVEFTARNAHRQKKTEVLWMNYGTICKHHTQGKHDHH